MDDPEQDGLGAVLRQVGTSSTEDLTRTLRAAAVPIRQRLELAWALFDGSRAAPQHRAKIQRLEAALIRKDELLAEWLFLSMLRELKGAGPDQRALCRDPGAVSLLARLLRSIGAAQPQGRALELRAVLQGPVMPLFLGAFRPEPEAGGAEYVAEVAGLWRVVVEATADGLEIVSAQPDHLAQLLKLVGVACLQTDASAAGRLGESLEEMASMVAYALRCSCESSLNPRKMFALFDERLLVPALQLAGSARAETRSAVLDMLQAGLFHVECMGRFIAASGDKQQQQPGPDSEQNYAGALLTALSAIVPAADGDVRARYAAALPGLLERYLQAATLVCAETRSMATSTIGLSAIAANPLGVSVAETSASCLGMFGFLYGLLAPLCSDERVLAATNRLVRAYFGSACFGTTRNVSALGSEVHQRQTAALDAWLTSLIAPILGDPAAPASVVALALEGIDFALDAGPDLVQTHSELVLDALSRAPDGAAEAGALALSHLVLTLQKGRRLDLLVCGLARIRADPSVGRTNLLATPAFAAELGRAVPQSMPYAQIGACVSALVDAIAAEAARAAPPAAGSKKPSRKRRRLSSGQAQPGTIEMLATAAAALVLATVAAVGTERQRAEYSQLLAEKYAQLMAALAADGLAWARLLLHYAFMEAASQVDGTERWLETCMYPPRVRSVVLPSAADSVDASSAGGARAAALGMLVAFQTAAGWSAFAAAHSAGVVPDAVSAQVDFEAAEAAVRDMASSLFPEACLADEQAAPGRAGGGWARWDGQAHSIGPDNAKDAQWRLLVDWLEVACEYTDASAMRRIATRIVAGLAVPTGGRASSSSSSSGSSSSGSEYAHDLLGQAAFFEAPRVRDAFVPALAGYALQMWTAHSGKPHKQTRLHRKIGHALHGISQSSAGEPSPELAEHIGAATKLAGAADGLEDRHRLSEAQAAAWIQLGRSLLRIPSAYWQPAQVGSVLALALAVDFGVASAAPSPADACALRAAARTLQARLLQHAPEALASLVPHAARAIEHWAGCSAQQLAHPGLAERSQQLVCLVAGLLAQAWLGGEDKDAGAACRKACKALYARLDQAEPLGMAMVLGAFGAIAAAAQQCADRSRIRSSDKWVALVLPWLERLAAQIAGRLQAGDLDRSADAHSSAARVALYCALRRLHDGFAGARLDSDLEAQAGAALQASPQSSGVLALALTLCAACGAAADKDPGDGAPRLLARLARFAASADGMLEPFARAVVVAVAGGAVQPGEGLSGAIVNGALEPLLRALGDEAFGALLASCLKTVRAGGGGSARATSVQLLLTLVRLAGRHNSGSGGDSGGTQRLKAVQRSVGSILSVLHAYVCASGTLDAALGALAVVGEVAVAAPLRLAMFDVCEAMAIVSSIASMPLAAAERGRAAELYCAMCRALGGIVRKHTGLALDSISVLVGVLRPLLHAFVTTQEAADGTATPWIVAWAPLPPQCAEAYGRVLSDLCRARRAAEPQGAGKRRGRDNKTAALVKMTRGTAASGVASVVTMYAPLILAEYCVIQSGGAAAPRDPRAYASRDGAEPTAFRGLTWRPAPVLSTTAATNSSSTSGCTIASPALREALLPGWYTLLDIMTSDDRATLLTLLATPPKTPSALGPARHDGASEVLKTLYQGYLDHYKFTGSI
ncbi:hypothetical protein H4R18_001042 [Coemansia javaensis]|uniref:Nucleolar 27S pre-rRNA processing Urb2/Npa2 C-terminal domain-containing protein n=1 Tax=Coemansia javaensis TaxID=2761396 RepID=A0A9W8HMQ5_9FUNG|nr:hypothetical protein H4R18_001042 [Coemansia javaensis]